MTCEEAFATRLRRAPTDRHAARWRRRPRQGRGGSARCPLTGRVAPWGESGEIVCAADTAEPGVHRRPAPPVGLRHEVRVHLQCDRGISMAQPLRHGHHRLPCVQLHRRERVPCRVEAELPRIPMDQVCPCPFSCGGGATTPCGRRQSLLPVALVPGPGPDRVAVEVRHQEVVSAGRTLLGLPLRGARAGFLPQQGDCLRRDGLPVFPDPGSQVLREGRGAYLVALGRAEYQLPSNSPHLAPDVNDAASSSMSSAARPRSPASTSAAPAPGPAALPPPAAPHAPTGRSSR